MAFIRKIKKPYGTYYALVENHRVDGKVRQRVIKYLGKSPNTIEIPVDPKLAAPLAKTLLSGETSTEEMQKIIEDMGIKVIGRIKKVSLTFNPPLRKLTLRVE